MLRDEHGMMPERGLFAVIGRFRRGQTLINELIRMFEHGIKTFAMQITQFRFAQTESPPKRRPGKPVGQSS